MKTQAAPQCRKTTTSTDDIGLTIHSIDFGNAKFEISGWDDFPGKSIRVVKIDELGRPELIDEAFETAEASFELSAEQFAVDLAAWLASRKSALAAGLAAVENIKRFRKNRAAQWLVQQ